MLYMHMDHSALTFHTTTVLCIKLPRQANKEGIYEAVKAARQVNELGVSETQSKSADVESK